LHDSSEVPNVTRYKRRPWVAALLSLFLPGLGHLYLGEVHRAVLALVLFAIAWFLMMALMLWFEAAPINVILGVLIFLGACMWIIVDVVRTARWHRFVEFRRWYQRWYALGAIVLLQVFAAPAVQRGIRDSFVEAFQLPTDSMAPTIQAGDYVLVRKQVPQILRQKLVVFYSPADPAKVVLKRVVAVTGDTIQMTNKRLRINGHQIRESYVQHVDRENDLYAPDMYWQVSALASHVDRARYRPTRDNWGPIVVPAGSVFVLGDNRDDSEDSRYWGFVRVSDITGYPKRIYFSVQNGVRWERIGRDLTRS
jgi:signal peptidase I